MNEIEKRKSQLKKQYENEKMLKLVAAIFIDIFGVLSYVIPGLGEIFDLVLAPISAILVYVLFGKKLKWAAFTFLEEMMPMTDVIPSATIAWYSMYVTNELETIEAMDKRAKLKQKTFDNLDLD
jgi:hypothetical protein